MVQVNGATTAAWLGVAILLLLDVHQATALRNVRVLKQNDVQGANAGQLLSAATAGGKPIRGLKKSVTGVYCAEDFTAAANQGYVMQAVANLAQTLGSTAADPADPGALTVAQGVAIAKAVAQTTDGFQAIAIAYAAALCQPGQTEEALSQALAVAVLCNSTSGCELLMAARATAMAFCSSSLGGEVYSYAYASTYATAALIGHCMVTEPGVKEKLPNFSLPEGLTAGLTRTQLIMLLPKHIDKLSCDSNQCGSP